MYSGLFFKLRDYLPLSALLTLYRSLFEPHLLYCNIIWCNTFPSYLYKLQTLQKKVIRTMFWSHFRDHTGPLFESSGVLKLTDLNIFLNVCTVYQVLNQGCQTYGPRAGSGPLDGFNPARTCRE